MKAIITLIICAALTLASSSCKKCDHLGATKYQSHAQIGEQDFRKCSSCGGYFIAIDGAQYRFFELPAGSGIDLQNDPRPINVSINWHIDTEQLTQDVVKIDAIRKD